jgi:pyruvate formate lyase activating enzyme
MPRRAALRKTSLIDFPGRVASVLFFPGCNLRCPYCHNAELALAGNGDAGNGGVGEDGTIPIEEALAAIQSRVGRVSGVVLSGGEPLVYADMAELAGTLRAMGLAVKLDTNGSFPDRIAAIGAQYVAMDLKTAPASYGRLRGAKPDFADSSAAGQGSAEIGGAEIGGAEIGERVKASMKLIRGLGVEYEFRITCAPGILRDSDIEGLVEVLEPEDFVILQAFRPGGCLDPSYDSVEAYPRSWMEALRARIADRAPKVRIRGG